MSGRDLLTDERRLFEEVCTTEWLAAGFQRVRKNKGAPGMDGVTMAEDESRLDEELSRLRADLESWTYQPAPVRRVEIPKPGGQGTRLPQVPTVRDRVVQATLKLLLEPSFEPLFSAHSYGFRPGWNLGQAVEAARAIVAGVKPCVVHLDLSKVFDRFHPDRLIARLGQTVPDKRILHLVGLVKRGVPRRQAAGAAFFNNRRWALSNASAVTRAYPVGWFIGELGQVIRSDQQLPQRFEVSQWIRLT